MKRFFLFAPILATVAIALVVDAPKAFAQNTVETLTPSTTPSVKVSPEKEKLIREFIQVSGFEKQFRQYIAMSLPQLSRASPSFPEAFWTLSRAKMEATYGVVLDTLIPIYDKYYSQEDLASMIAFYKSEVGQKMVANTPAIAQEIGDANERWVNKIISDTWAEIHAEEASKGVLKPSAGIVAVRRDAGLEDSSFTIMSSSGPPSAIKRKVIVTSSGLKYEDITVGVGTVATYGKTCVIAYTGTLTNGVQFDSTYRNGKPLSFHLGKGEVIEGLNMGVAGMKIGGRRRLVVPASLAHGVKTKIPIPPNATLIYDIELLQIK